jgi:hypothetical protein
VIITPLFTGLLPRARSADYTMNGPQSDTYDIMLESLGTTPLEIIYPGRLEYAHVCLQVLRGKRDMWRATQGRPVDEVF